MKAAGVECYFEKENVWTFDGKGELLITLMSSLAQEESRSISQNVTWGQRKRMSDGKVTLPYSHFLGYERGADGRPKIVESEAKIVRQIYTMYLQGSTIRQIAARLTTQGIPTPAGKTQWSVSTVKSILQNEKYRGDALLQKTFCEDFLTKKMIKNEGQVQQYYVVNSHNAIVSPEMFEMVQQELAKHALLGTGRSNASPFSGKVMCSECGEYFSPRTWHSQDPYKKRVWQCSGKYRERAATHCVSPHVTEEQLQRAFVEAFNGILGERERYIANMEPAIALLTGCADLDGESEVLQERMAGLAAQMQALVDDNAGRKQDQAAFHQRYGELKRRYDVIKNRMDTVFADRAVRVAKQEAMRRFLETVRQRNALLEAFDEPLFRATVEKITVQTDSQLTFAFRDGREVTVRA